MASYRLRGEPICIVMTKLSNLIRISKLGTTILQLVCGTEASWSITRLQEIYRACLFTKAKEGLSVWEGREGDGGDDDDEWNFGEHLPLLQL